MEINIYKIDYLLQLIFFIFYIAIMSIASKQFEIITIFILSFCGFAANAADYTIQQIDPQTLRYHGKIVEGSASDLRSRFNAEIRQLRITSPGGSAQEAMLIGRLLAEKGTSLVVDRYCIAACANYLFLGAKTKTLEPDSLLGFQHNLARQNFADLKQRFDRQEISSQDVGNNSSKFTASEHLQILEWEYLLSLQLETNTLDRIYQKMQEGIDMNRDVSRQMRSPPATNLSGFYEEVAEPNSIERKLQIAKSRKSYSLKTDKNGTGTVYFPRAEFLGTLGIKGINAYPYPDNENALNALFHRDLDQITTIAYVNSNAVAR